MTRELLLQSIGLLTVMAGVVALVWSTCRDVKAAWLACKEDDA